MIHVLSGICLHEAVEIHFSIAFFLFSLCHLKNYPYLCGVQTSKRYDTAGSKGLLFLYPYIRDLLYKDITAPCRGVEIPTELCFEGLNST